MLNRSQLSMIIIAFVMFNARAMPASASEAEWCSSHVSESHVRYSTWLSPTLVRGQSPGQEEGDDVLKPGSESGTADGIPSENLDLGSDLDLDEPWDRLQRETGQRSLAVTPGWGYSNLTSGDTKHAAELLIDLALPVNQSGSLLVHGGAGVGFVGGGTIFASTVDVSRLADLEGAGPLSLLASGIAVDLFGSNDLFDDGFTLAQLRGGFGFALSENTDLGVIGIWPLHGDTSLVDREFVDVVGGPGYFVERIQPYDLSRQVKLYLASTFGESLETYWYVGHRQGPDAVTMGCDAAWTLASDSALVTGVYADDSGAVGTYVGLQIIGGPNRLIESRFRGGTHRLSRQGFFGTASPTGLNLSRDSTAPIQSTFVFEEG